MRALTDPHLWFAYWIGVLLTLDKTMIKSSELYVGGSVDPVLSGWFDERLREKGLGA
jgi:hypothetical protein